MIQAVESQPSDDVDSHIPARGRSVDNFLHGLPFGDQASPTRGITLNTALDRPERFVLARGVGNPNEGTNALYDELQQSRSSTEQLPCTYTTCQATATGASGASDRYTRQRQAALPGSDVRYPIQETSQQSQEHSQQLPSLAAENVCTCPQCQPISH